MSSGLDIHESRQFVHVLNSRLEDIAILLTGWENLDFVGYIIPPEVVGKLDEGLRIAFA